jgi:PAS domain S-box-containing protein
MDEGMTPTPEDLKRDNEELRSRVEEAEAIVRAISRHEVDAFVVQQMGEDGVLVLDGVDKPYRRLIERMQQGAAVIGADGVIVYVNGRLTELLESTPSEILGSDFSRFIGADDRAEFAQFLKRGHRDDAEYEVELIRASGIRLPALLNATPMGDPQGILCLIVTDLTQHRRFVEERERLQQEQSARAAAERVAEVLRTADRRKDEFLAMLGHELRNPLAPLRNGLQILNLIGSRELAARQTREMMGRQLEGLIRLVDDLLDVGRVTQGKIDLHPERTDLKHVATRALESARSSIDEREHRVELSMPDAPVPINGDPVRLTQVVTNLLNNAAKFTPHGGRIQVVVKSDLATNQGLVVVRDNGMGIAPNMLTRVFDLFAQADPSVGRAEGGLGIGLTLARRLVEMHAGTLEASSEGIGRGSEFSMRLPLAEDAREAGAGPAHDDLKEATRLSSKRILVVDDNEDAAESLTMLLRLFGHEVREAYNGESALSMLGDFVPDLLLLDLGLPGMDGYELARHVRSHPKLSGVRLVALSGYGSEEDRRSTSDAGFDAHFVKPVEFASIQSLLASI